MVTICQNLKCEGNIKGQATCYDSNSLRIPITFFVIANLIRNYRNEYNFEKVIELGEKGLNISLSQTDFNSQSQRQRIYLDLAYALLNTDQIDRAEEICKEAIKENPDSLDIFICSGRNTIKKGGLCRCLTVFQKISYCKR